jgi:hypothetical protein
VLTLWRVKLRVSEHPLRIFDAVRDVVSASAVIAGKHRRALDSTVLDDAVQQDTMTVMIVTQMRRVRKFAPELHGVFIHEENLAGDRLPADYEDRADIDRLVSELVEDANELVFATDELDLDETRAPSGCPGMRRSSVTLAAARAARARELSLGDRPPISGEPYVGDPQFAVMLDAEEVVAGTVGYLSDRVPIAADPFGQRDSNPAHCQCQRGKSNQYKILFRNPGASPGQVHRTIMATQRAARSVPRK